MKQFKIAFLSHLIAKGPASADVVPIPVKFDDGRNAWRGNVVNELAQDGLICIDGFANSLRPSRHGALLRRWRLIDPAKARKYVKHLRNARKVVRYGN